jgi:hypothetical protein
MMAPNVPPMEMRSPGAQKGLAGLGIISVTAPQYMNGGGAYILGPSVTTAPGPPNVVESINNPIIPASEGNVPNPVFYDTQGNIIASAVCGSTYNMTVPGFDGQTLMIVQTKNGAPNFSGPLLMPVRNYGSTCGQDEGTYNVQAFTQPGTLLGSTTFVVLPAPGAPGTGPSGLPPSPIGTGVPISTSQAAPPPGTTSATSALPAAATGQAIATTGLGSLTSTDWIILGAILLGVFAVGQASKGR